MKDNRQQTTDKRRCKGRSWQRISQESKCGGDGQWWLCDGATSVFGWFTRASPEMIASEGEAGGRKRVWDVECMSSILFLRTREKYEFRDNVSMLLLLPLPQSILHFSRAIFFFSFMFHSFIGWCVGRSCVYVHFWLNVNDNIELLPVEVLCSAPLVMVLSDARTLSHTHTHTYSGLINFSAPISCSLAALSSARTR